MYIYAPSVFLLSVVFNMMIVYAVRTFTLRMSLIVTMMVPVFIFPAYLLVMACYWSKKKKNDDTSTCDHDCSYVRFSLSSSSTI